MKKINDEIVKNHSNNVFLDLKLCGKCGHLGYWDGYFCMIKMKIPYTFPDNYKPYQIKNIIECENFIKRGPCKDLRNYNIPKDFICPFWCFDSCEFYKYRNKEGNIK